jgi:hypothetical protein
MFGFFSHELLPRFFSQFIILVICFRLFVNDDNIVVGRFCACR